MNHHDRRGFDTRHPQSANHSPLQIDHCEDKIKFIFFKLRTYLNMAGEPIIGEYKVGVNAFALGDGDAVYPPGDGVGLYPPGD